MSEARGGPAPGGHSARRAHAASESHAVGDSHAVDQPLAHEPFDLVVIGAGLVGAAIARAFAAYDLRIALVEARADVGDGTSKANTAILHTGFDATPGTLESALVRRGYRMLSEYARSAGIPIECTGAVLVAWDSDQLQALPDLQAKAIANGYLSTEIIPSAEVYRLVPCLGPGALGGLTVPDESVTCTWTVNLALATDAVQRGVCLLLDALVEDVDVGPEVSTIATSRGSLRARWVVNAAGLGSDLIDRMLGFDRFTITPRKGELLVFDKLTRPMVPRIVLPVPTKVGKGVLVSPTVYGNVMVGPTAQEIEDRTDTSTSAEGLAFLMGKLLQLMPALAEEEITAAYAGLRAATQYSDYVIDVDPVRRYVLAGGIRSTGLTACMAIAEHLCQMVKDTHGLRMAERSNLASAPRMPNLGEAFTRPYQDDERIAADPEYGRIICFCERVSAGEIRDALHSTIPATTLSGLRRRTRAMNGRCQGFSCGAEVRARLEAMGHSGALEPAQTWVQP